MKILTYIDRSNRSDGQYGNTISEGDGCWLILGLSRAECRVIGRSENMPQQYQIEKVETIAGVMEPKVDFVAVLSPDLKGLFEQSARALIEGIGPSRSQVTILLPWKEPPERFVRPDGMVRSFFCSSSIFSDLLLTKSNYRIENLCFGMLEAILNNKIYIERLLIEQLPLLQTPQKPTQLKKNAALIMAHRGSIKYLEAALRSIRQAASSSVVTVRVGLDVEDIAEYKPLIEEFRNVEFYRVSPAPAGPYVIRQQLIDWSSEYSIIFQDSDDLSTHDRFTLQYEEMLKMRAGLIGCHELCVDELNGRVESLRFPLDISTALSYEDSTALSYQAKDPILPATTMIARELFNKAGGFSTNRKIANDTQFILRAYFSVRMRNIDKFLYIRRRHKTALTVVKETALGTALRQSLAEVWAADFEAIKSGRVRLESTSLMPQRIPGIYTFDRLSLPSECDSLFIK